MLAMQRVQTWENRWKASLGQAMQNDPHPELRVILQVSKSKVLKAVRFIRYLYRENEPIRAFSFYINFVRKYAKSVDLKRIEPFQFQDMLMAILNQECMWLRTRRGGKTRDLTLVNIFWVIIGKDPIWFAPQSDQLKQAHQYFMANPFWKSTTNDYVYIHGCDKTLETSNLTLGKSASKGKDCITYDEGAKIPKGYLIYDYYKFSRVIIAGKLWEGDKHILYASTAARNTAIEEEYLLLQTIAPDLISMHTYKDCWWISEEWVDQERAANLNDPWFVDQEYLTLFVNRGGTIFDNVNLMSIKDMQELGLRVQKIGVDINQTEMVAFIAQLGNDIFILAEGEYNWLHDTDIYNFIRPFSYVTTRGITWQIDPHFEMEIEAMGYNEKLATWMSINIPNCVLNYEWDDEAKGDRVHLAKSGRIFADPSHTPFIYQDLINAIYHKFKKGYVKDNAHPCHWLESFLHAIGADVGKFIQPSEPTQAIESAAPYHRRQKQTDF